jgi:hypothetical protein
MPRPAITPKFANPWKLVETSAPYAIAAPRAATSVGLSVPVIARASASWSVFARRSSRKRAIRRIP